MIWYDMIYHVFWVQSNHNWSVTSKRVPSGSVRWLQGKASVSGLDDVLQVTLSYLCVTHILRSKWVNCEAAKCVKKANLLIVSFWGKASKIILASSVIEGSPLFRCAPHHTLKNKSGKFDKNYICNLKKYIQTNTGCFFLTGAPQFQYQKENLPSSNHGLS